MQDLAAEKAERLQGFKKQQGRHGHALFDYQTGNLLQESSFFGSEPQLGRCQSEGVDKLLAQSPPDTHALCISDLVSVGNAAPITVLCRVCGWIVECPSPQAVVLRLSQNGA